MDVDYWVRLFVVERGKGRDKVILDIQREVKSKGKIAFEGIIHDEKIVYVAEIGTTD